MASAIVRKPCVKCQKHLSKDICVGCLQSFCIEHYDEHQLEIASEMHDVSQKLDEFQAYLAMENIYSEHPLILRINEWEQRSISRIQEVAENVRTKLKQSLDEVKEIAKISLSQVADELEISRANTDYTEIELKSWMDQLESLKQQLKDLNKYELYGGIQDDTNASIIRLIKLKPHRTVSKLMPRTRLALHCIHNSLKISVTFFHSIHLMTVQDSN
jgi:hypothetical protein